jgi:hypothetical protein
MGTRIYECVWTLGRPSATRCSNNTTPTFRTRRFEIVHIDSAIDRFAIFSDGVENLFLDQRKRCAPAPFFERLLQPVSSWQGHGRSRKLSAHLRNYLDGDTVCAETDDDKSLILGARP